MIDELVHTASMICLDDGERWQGGKMYRMHRPVRQFIVSYMKLGSALWNG